MSYDVELTIDTGPDSRACVGWWNYTSNCSGMWRHALGGDIGMADLDGKPAAEAGPLLSAAAERMQADPDTYKAMDPPNGWGDHVGAALFLGEIADACRTHPRTTLRVSH